MSRYQVELAITQPGYAQARLAVRSANKVVARSLVGTEARLARLGRPRGDLAALSREVDVASAQSLRLCGPTAHEAVAGEAWRITHRLPPRRTGKLRASILLTSTDPAASRNLPDGSYADPASTPPAQALAAHQPGKPLTLVWSALRGSFDYAPVMEAGRHRDSLGRMAGSLQAPHGWAAISIPAIARRVRDVIRRVLLSGPGRVR